MMPGALLSANTAQKLLISGPYCLWQGKLEINFLN